LTFGGLSLESGEALVAPRPKPQRLALLAVLAAAGERGCTRERLVGLFWPEGDDERGRHSLRQMLYALRQETGEDLVEAASSLFLNPKAISSDLAEFRAALATGDRRRAGALSGAFLDGFYLSGSPEFERWVEQERTRLAESAVAALVALAGEATAIVNHDEAAGCGEPHPDRPAQCPICARLCPGAGRRRRPRRWPTSIL
jgi:serine/threonine-protein kinase